MPKAKPLKSTAIEGLVAGIVAERAEDALDQADPIPKPEDEVKKVVATLAKGQEIESIRWRCKRDPWFFKQRLIKTIDEHDSEHPVKHIPPWPHLPLITEILQRHKLVLIEKARQVFITWTVLADLLHTALFHDHSRIFVQSKKYSEACELVSMRTGVKSKFGRGRIHALYQYLLPGLFTDVQFFQGEAQFENGAVIKALAGGEEQVRQHTVTRYFADEAARIPEFEDTWVAARPSVEGGGKLFAATTPKGKEAFYYLFKDFRGTGTVTEPLPGMRVEECDNGVCIVTLNWWIVPGRDAAWYARATTGMPPAKARQEYDIDYGVFEGMPVYPQFRRESHVKALEYQPDLPVIRGWDFGYKRAVVIFAQKVGRSLNILHAVLSKQSSTKMLAIEVVRDSDELFHNGTFEDYCDPAGIGDRGASDESSLEILEAYPFNISPSWRRTQIMNGVDVISKLIQENRLAVNTSPSCEPVMDAFLGGYAFTEQGDKPKKDGIHEHYMDATRYLVDNTFDAADDPAPEVPLSEEKVIEMATKRVYAKCERLKEEYRQYVRQVGGGTARRPRRTRRRR